MACFHSKEEMKEHLKLIREVKIRPTLYNHALPENKSRVAIFKAWTEVAANMNLPATECRRMWKTLRSSLDKYLRKPSNEFVRPYYYLGPMKFVLPYIYITDPLSIYCSIMSSQQESSNTHKDCEQNRLKQQATDRQEPDRSIIQVEVKKEVESPPRRPPEDMEYPSSSQDNTIDTIADPNTESAARTAIAINNHDEPYDLKVTRFSRKRFLLSLLPDVYAFDDRQMRTFRIRALRLVNETLRTRRGSNV